MADDAVVEEQKVYYRERTHEYDDWWQRKGRYDKGEEFRAAWQNEADEIRAAVSGFDPVPSVLELAGGTGNWTVELAQIADELTVVDQSPESLEVNRQKVESSNGRAQLTHVEADLFDYEPVDTYDLVFFSFWQSHVPDNRFEAFWEMVDSALAPGGRVFLLDNAHPSLSTNLHAAPIDIHTKAISTDQGGAIDLLDGTAVRTLSDGREFQIVKRYWRPDDYIARMADLGWNATAGETANFFFWSTLQTR